MAMSQNYLCMVKYCDGVALVCVCVRFCYSPLARFPARTLRLSMDDDNEKERKNERMKENEKQ